MPTDSQSILLFDVETTGTSPESDQIIELCVQRSLGGEATAKTWRFKPIVPIHPAAQAVHGITMEDLRDCPSFSDHCAEICALFDAAEVIVGYNVQFDLTFLLNECNRAKGSAPDFSAKKIVDPFQLWRHFEPRTLAGAHQRFVGPPLEGAHAASADVAATARVLQGMLTAFDLENAGWEEISQLCPIHTEQKTWIGPSNHFLWQQQEAVFGFGKHRGRSILVVAKSDNGSYVDWMSSKTFPKHVLEIAVRARSSSEDDFYLWLRQEFPLR